MTQPITTFNEIFGVTPTRSRHFDYSPRALRKYGRRGGMVPIRKDDDDDDERVSVADLSDDDIDSIVADIDERNGGSGSNESRHIDHLADMLCEAQGISREQALWWLLNKPNGQALIRRTLGKRKEKSMTTLDAGQWQIIAKGAPLSFVQAIEKGTTPAGDPYELTMTAAKAAHPGLTEARAFAKFVDQNPILKSFAFNDVLKSDPHAYLKATPLTAASAERMPTEPMVTGGTDPGVAGRAYAQLMQMAERQHQAGKYKTVAQAFAAVMEDSANVKLAADAVLRSRARNSFLERNV